MSVKAIFLIILVIITIHSKAQNIDFNDYYPNHDFFISKEGVKKIEEKYNNAIKGLNEKSEQEKKKKEFIEEKFKNFINDNNEQFSFIVQKKKALPVINSYTDDNVLLKEIEPVILNIIEKNPALQSENYVFLLNNSSVANAASYGYGIVDVNLGLLPRIRSEEEIAFILSHELAHNYLKHTEIGLDTFLTTFYSTAFQEKIKKLNKQEYNSYSEVTKLMYGYTSGQLKHNRAYEYAADSLGLIFFTNAGYNAMSALSCVKYLDSLDFPVSERELPLEKYFNSDKFPFKKTWLNFDSYKTSFKKQDFSIPDSLKTHPDCKNRAIKLSKIIEKQRIISKPEKGVGYSSAKAKRLSLFELIYVLRKQLIFDESLYSTILLLEEYPQNPFLNYSFFSTLTNLYISQDLHLFSQFVSSPDDRIGYSMNHFLMFLHNLNHSDYKKICLYNYSKVEFLLKSELDKTISKMFYNYLNDVDVSKDIKTFNKNNIYNTETKLLNEIILNN